MDTSKIVSLFDGQVDVKFHATGHKYYRRVNEQVVKYHDPSIKEDIEVEFPQDEVDTWIKLGGKSASVTSKAALDKPELYNWFTDVAVNEFKNQLLHVVNNTLRMKHLEQAEGLAKGARWKKFKDAGKVGTEIHGFLNQFIQAKIDGKKVTKTFLNSIMQMSVPAVTCAQRFLEWEKENIKEYIETEFIIYDPELDHVGTTDFVAINNEGKLWIYDGKSGTGIYPSDVMQLGFYRKGYALRCGKFPQGASILHFEDKNKIHEHKNLDHEANAIAFACAVYLINWRNSLNI